MVTTTRSQNAIPQKPDKIFFIFDLDRYYLFRKLGSKCDGAMQKFTLRQLDYFVIAAESESLAEAASRANVSQPSISTAIAKLEDQLGVQLFVRHHAQGISLTHMGRRVLGDARNLLRQAADFEHNAADSGEALRGALEIGCFVTFAPAFMPALITAFSRMHPDVSLRLHEATQDELVAGLTAGRLDLALLYDLELPDRIQCEHVATGHPYALLHAGHPLAKRRRIPLRDLSSEPFILLDVPPSRTYFLGLFEAAGLSPEVAFASSSLEMVRGLVGSGAGFSLLVTRPHGDATYDGSALAIRPIDTAARPSEISLARLEQISPTRIMETFSSFCRDWFRDHARLEKPEQTRRVP